MLSTRHSRHARGVDEIRGRGRLGTLAFIVGRGAEQEVGANFARRAEPKNIQPPEPAPLSDLGSPQAQQVHTTEHGEEDDKLE